MSILGSIMKKENVDKFEKLKVQLDSLHQEMSMLAKKSPNDAVNTFKIKLINVTIASCNEFFGVQYRPFADFNIFSVDELPTNSDITFIISQYIECAEKFRSDNIRQQGGYWLWNITDSKEEVRTGLPKKLSK